MAPRQSKSYKFVPVEQKKSMQTWMLAGVLFVLVLAIAGVAWFVLKGSPPTPISSLPGLNITPPVRNATEACTTDDCIAQRALQEQNPSLCDLVTNDTAQQQCFVSLASADLGACERVLDYNIRKECTFTHARNEQSVRPCQRLGLTDGDKRACILTVDSCYFEEGTEQALCRALNLNNVSQCHAQENCVLAYATRTGNYTSCGELEGIANQYACVSTVKNQSVCGELPDQVKQNYCYQLYAERSNQIDWCGFIETREDYQWQCYAHFAIRENQPALCDNVDLLKKWTCYANYSLETGNIEGCRSIHDLALITKFNCYFDLALELGDPSVCEDITYAADKERCYSAVIYQTPEKIKLEYCPNILVSHWKDACYSTVAREHNDPSICTQYIAGAGEQQLCQQRVANAQNGSNATNATGSST